MNQMRRMIMTAFFPGGILVAASLLEAKGQQQNRFPRIPGLRSAQRPVPPTAIPGPESPSIPRKAILKEEQKEITKDVAHLFTLAKDLKTQAAKMDSTQVLSMDFVRKTEEIEKLAKKIRNLAQR